MLKTFALLFVCFFASSVLQAEISRPGADRPWLRVLTVGSDETKPVNYKLLPGGKPSGKPLRANPVACSSFSLEKLLAQASPTPKGQVQALQGFFDRCEKPLSRFAPNKVGGLLELVDQNYAIVGRTDLTELVFNLPFGVTIHGLLGLKPGTRPRPLVVAVSGTGGNLNDVGARTMLASLFDETPFNVLILPSSTGSQFISDNHILSLGGFEESRFVFEIIKLLAGDDSPYRKLISSFHVSGVSLGGNTSLLAGVYATNNPLPSGQPQIQSVLGYCPVVDLQTAIDDLDRTDLIGRGYRHVIAKDTMGKRDVLGTLVPSPLPQVEFPLGQHQNIKYAFDWINPSLKNLLARPDFLIAPFTTTQPEPATSFWAANNYLNFAGAAKIPTVLFASQDDFVVNPEHHALAVEALIKSSGSPAPVAVFHPKRGWHCMMTQVYGEDIFSTALKGMILSNSPEFSVAKTQIPFGERLNQTMKNIGPRAAGEKYFGYHWHARGGSPNAHLTYQIFTPGKHLGQTQLCRQFSPYVSYEGCFRQGEVDVRLSALSANLKSPDASSKAQAEALTRWLNSHVRVLTSSGVEPIDTLDAPASFEVSND